MDRFWETAEIQHYVNKVDASVDKYSTAIHFGASAPPLRFVVSLGRDVELAKLSELISDRPLIHYFACLIHGRKKSVVLGYH